MWNHPLKNKGLFAGQRHLGLQWQGIEDGSRAREGHPWLDWRFPVAETILGATTTPPQTSICPSAGLKMGLNPQRLLLPVTPSPVSSPTQDHHTFAHALGLGSCQSSQELRSLGASLIPKPATVPSRAHVPPSAKYPLSSNSSVSSLHLLTQMEAW